MRNKVFIALILSTLLLLTSRSVHKNLQWQLIYYLHKPVAGCFFSDVNLTKALKYAGKLWRFGLGGERSMKSEKSYDFEYMNLKRKVNWITLMPIIVPIFGKIAYCQCKNRN